MNYDVIVVGAGLTGSALAYELAKKRSEGFVGRKKSQFF